MNIASQSDAPLITINSVRVVLFLMAAYVIINICMHVMHHHEFEHYQLLDTRYIALFAIYAIAIIPQTLLSFFIASIISRFIASKPLQILFIFLIIFIACSLITSWLSIGDDSVLMHEQRQLINNGSLTREGIVFYAYYWLAFAAPISCLYTLCVLDKQHIRAILAVK